jgi:hypothetical protein
MKFSAVLTALVVVIPLFSGQALAAAAKVNNAKGQGGNKNGGNNNNNNNNGANNATGANNNAGGGGAQTSLSALYPIRCSELYLFIYYQLSILQSSLQASRATVKKMPLLARLPPSRHPITSSIFALPSTNPSQTANRSRRALATLLRWVSSLRRRICRHPNFSRL